MALLQIAEAKSVCRRCPVVSECLTWALESGHCGPEHAFTIETDAGIQKAVEVLFDLEGLYLWWMHHIGPLTEAAEDVDDPRVERATFFVHKNLDSFKPLSQKEPYYDPSGTDKTPKGGINLARTFFEPGQDRPKDLFALGAENGVVRQPEDGVGFAPSSIHSRPPVDSDRSCDCSG